MKQPFIRALALVITLCTTLLAAGQSVEAVEELLALEHPIRVLLTKKPLRQANLTIESPSGFILYAPHESTYKKTPQKKLTTKLVGSTLQFGNIPLTNQPLYIMPAEGLLTVNNIPYEGYLALSKDRRSCYLVNHLSLEEYIAAVLPYEAVPSWPDEVLKAICIAARTYVLAKIEERKKDKIIKPYDVHADVYDQVYNGKKSPYCLKHIIEATKGTVVTKDNTLIMTLYNATCGGVIPGHRNSEFVRKYPYLKRSYACNHCSEKKNYYRWQTSYSFDDLNKKLTTKLPNFSGLKEIKVPTYDQAGTSEDLHLLDTNGNSHNLKMLDFRMMFPTIRSYCCTLSVKGNMLHAQGKGFGHHTGLCQWGAYYMDSKGHTYKDILEFYYPDTTLVLFSTELHTA